MKMISTLKHIFIPHHGNDYKPHFFREKIVALILFTSIFMLGVSALSYFFIYKTLQGTKIASSVIIDLTNEARLNYNQNPLLKSEKLNQAALLKGEDMASKEYFSHDSPDGITPWYWFKKVDYNFLYAGENLAINFNNSSDIERAWLLSPTHRANIVNVDFKEIGVATVNGYYNNTPTIYVVQMFGTPSNKENKILNTRVDKNFVDTTDVKISPKGEVKGASVKADDLASSTLEKIVSTEEMIVVKNAEAENLLTNNNQTITYSTWYEKLIFKSSYYIDFIYKILLVIVFVSLILMILIEIKKQHFIHILYGVFLLLLLMIFIYINQSFF